MSLYRAGSQGILGPSSSSDSRRVRSFHSQLQPLWEEFDPHRPHDAPSGGALGVGALALGLRAKGGLRIFCVFVAGPLSSMHPWFRSGLAPRGGTTAGQSAPESRTVSPRQSNTEYLSRL